jgi:hypothetical protein
MMEGRNGDLTAFPSYPKELFNATIIQPFVCGVCNNVPNADQAMEHKSCGRIFCPNCIVLRLSQAAICPTCKIPIQDPKAEIRALNPQNLQRQILMLSLKMRCPSSAQGPVAHPEPSGPPSGAATHCTWIDDWANLAAHAKVCAFAMYPCKWGCQQFFTRAKLQLHETQECGSRTVVCEACHKQVIFSLLTSHKQKECPMTLEAPMPCRYAKIGCSTIGGKGVLQAHEAESMKAHFAMMITHIARLKGSIAETDTQIAKLKAHNALRPKPLPPPKPPRPNHYFQKCKNNHPLEVVNVAASKICSACGKTVAVLGEAWQCQRCNFTICLDCANINVVEGKEQFLYTFCPECTSTHRVLALANHIRMMCRSCASLIKPGSPLYYCVYCNFGICSKCQMPLAL